MVFTRPTIASPNCAVRSSRSYFFLSFGFWIFLPGWLELTNCQHPYPLALGKLHGFLGQPRNGNEDLVQNARIIGLVVEIEYPLQSHGFLVPFDADGNAMGNYAFIFGRQYVHVVESARA